MLEICLSRTPLPEKSYTFRGMACTKSDQRSRDEQHYFSPGRSYRKGEGIFCYFQNHMENRSASIRSLLGGLSRPHQRGLRSSANATAVALQRHCLGPYIIGFVRNATGASRGGLLIAATTLALSGVIVLMLRLEPVGQGFSPGAVAIMIAS